MTRPITTSMTALNDGNALPSIGLGTFGLRGPSGIEAMVAAIGNGYRLLDTAVGYGNEREVGEAVRRSGVPTSELWITTKITGRGHGYQAARRSIEESRTALGVAQIGLHLIHWPTPSLGRYVETWRALVDAQRDGEIRSIGVSNFTLRYLDPVIDATGVVPSVNQIEVHPHFPQEEQRRQNLSLGIRTLSWSPLGRGRPLLQASQVAGPARRLGVTPAQVVLRWHRQQGLVPVPRSADRGRQRENLDTERFDLTSDELAAITGLGRHGGRLWGGDPDTTEFM